jgi:hypothetical protein
VAAQTGSVRQPRATAGRSERSNTQEARQMAWQYKVVYVDVRGRISSEGQEAIIDRGERQSSFIRGYINSLGRDGWELVGIQHLGMRQTAYYIFKKEGDGEVRPPRPAEDDAGSGRGPAENVAGTA